MEPSAREHTAGERARALCCAAVDDLLARVTAEARPRVQALIDPLLAADPVARTRGLDAIAALARDGDAFAEALPALLALATRRGYREGSALLARLYARLAAADDPPRSGPPPDRRAAAIWTGFRGSLPALLAHAHRTSDPEAARVAALTCARYREFDAQVEPLLVALASGAPAGDDRARILYALARIQAERGARFHPSIAAALHRDGALDPETLDPETLAVALALAEHDPPLPLKARVARTLRSALGRPLSDPRSWGRTLEPAALERALARLEA